MRAYTPPTPPFANTRPLAKNTRPFSRKSRALLNESRALTKEADGSDYSDYDYTVIGCAKKGEDEVNTIYIIYNIYSIEYPLSDFPIESITKF